MTKPDDIPQDVWEMARDVTRNTHDWMGPHEVKIFISRAIMAERERWQAVIQTMDELAVTEKTCFDLVVRERKQMAEDWCNFCEAIGIDLDTHEAVAAQIKGMFEP